MATHPLFNDFKANKPSFGAWLTMPGYFHARAMAQSHPDLSWIIIDCEHGLTSMVPGAAEAVSAIQGVKANMQGPSAVLRIPATSVSDSTSWQIKYALDSGARGVLVPYVGTAEKAREIVQDSRFPEPGKNFRRGFGSAFTHLNWGITSLEYKDNANEHVLVMVQIESKEGVENVEEIAKVDGIDVLFIGPNDLSISLGYPMPAPDVHPEVEKVIQHILQVCKQNNKKCAIFCTNGAEAARRAREGFDMMNVSVDLWALQGGIKTELDVAYLHHKQG
ncbi:Pyruvate/Phosphoenolpyruvate kinase-like domain-containing protein [Flagelloscypha sp. PMI_526]|nr:Pyruvate/Phosphoenolpyruvate kinase-like domain-containing protein [Flagelloscypha sp. PMI_526]